MYIITLQIHHYLSWFVLLAALFALFRSWYGTIFKKWWSPTDIIAGMLFSISIDLQLVAGIILYAGLSPITTSAFEDFGTAVKDPGIRFYAIGHIAAMLLAVIFVHVGRSKAGKAQFPARKHRISAIFYTIATLLILSRIPWERIFAL
jgi:hypothetical protein